MIDWDYERSQCAFPSDDPPEAAAAPGIAPREPLGQMTVIHSSEIVADPKAFEGEYVPAGDYDDAERLIRDQVEEIRTLQDSVDSRAKAYNELAEQRDALEADNATLREQLGQANIDCPLCGVNVKQVASATLSLALWQHVGWVCPKSREAASRAALIALRPYIRHDRECPRSIALKFDLGSGWAQGPSYVKPCTCGLDSLTQTAGLDPKT